MKDTLQCADKGALVAFVYDECEPGERRAIAAHVERCPACRDEIEGMGGARVQLAAWTAPDVTLGFRVSETSAPAVTGAKAKPSRVLPDGVEPGAADGSGGAVAERSWWQRPLPAWAQAAAAAVIFAAGLMLGSVRGVESPAPAVVASDPAPTTVARTVASRTPLAAVSRDDLAQLAQQLRAEMSQQRAAASTPGPRLADDKAVLDRVQVLIAESEERQRQELALRTAALARDIDLQRRADLQQVQLRMGPLQGITGAEVREQREALRFVMNALQAR